MWVLDVSQPEARGDAAGICHWQGTKVPPRDWGWPGGGFMLSPLLRVLHPPLCSPVLRTTARATTPSPGGEGGEDEGHGPADPVLHC